MTRTTQLPKWVWELVDSNRSGAPGDITKLFRNEHVKAPGAFAVDAPSHDATIFCRETIQNSWDAGRALRRSLGEIRPFELRFEFKTLEGPERSQMIEFLDLDSLARVANNNDARLLGIGHDGCLDFRGTEALRTLVIRERGTTGMFGPWEGSRSRLYKALCGSGFTEKEEGSGGSYGYGKAGMIRGSATRTIVAYTCFQEREDDPGVTRRLLGMTYWGAHEHDGHSRTGWARFGDRQDEVVEPFANEEADRVAAALGLGTRREEEEEWGTTLLLIGPTFEPSDLNRAIERNWWPALEREPQFDLSVLDQDAGSELVPRPRRDPLLMSFIRSFEIAAMPQDNKVIHERAPAMQSFKHPDLGSLKVGQLGLHADVEGWSYPSQDDTTEEHKSLIALVRSPGMVVEYRPMGGTRPFVRGTFIADDEIDDLLRSVEPKSHDAWQTQPTEDGNDPQAAKLAASILHSRLPQQVGLLRREVAPPSRDRREVHLPVFETLMRDLWRPAGGRLSDSPPPAPPRNVSITMVAGSGLEALDTNDANSPIRLSGSVDIALMDRDELNEEEPVEVRLTCKLEEDGAAGRIFELTIDPPAGFDLRETGAFIGRLTKGKAARFKYHSASFAQDWSARLIINAELEDAQ